jgi:hypothetical protein
MARCSGVSPFGGHAVASPSGKGVTAMTITVPGGSARVTTGECNMSHRPPPCSVGGRVHGWAAEFKVNVLMPLSPSAVLCPAGATHATLYLAPSLKTPSPNSCNNPNLSPP